MGVTSQETDWVNFLVQHLQSVGFLTDQSKLSVAAGSLPALKQFCPSVACNLEGWWTSVAWEEWRTLFYSLLGTRDFDFKKSESPVLTSCGQGARCTAWELGCFHGGKPSHQINWILQQFTGDSQFRASFWMTCFSFVKGMLTQIGQIWHRQFFRVQFSILSQCFYAAKRGLIHTRVQIPTHAHTLASKHAHTRIRMHTHMHAC